MIIDAHHHIWDRRLFDHGWLTEPTLSTINHDFSITDWAAAAGRTIAGAVIVQALEDVAESAWLLAQAHDQSVALGVVGWVDFTTDVPAQIANLRAGTGGEKLCGVRIMAQGYPDPNELLSPQYRAGLNAYAELGLPLDVVCRQDQIASVIELARLMPELTIVLDHFGKPQISDSGLAQWRELITEVGQVANIVVKVSGLATEADWATWQLADLTPVITHTIASVPSDRLMFGSDWPVSILAISYGRWLEVVNQCIAGLAQSNRQEILGLTARRVYGL